MASIEVGNQSSFDGSTLIEHIIPNDGNVTCCRTPRMPIRYKAAAIGQSLVDGQEVHKVKAPKSGKHDLKSWWRMQ